MVEDVPDEVDPDELIIGPGNEPTQLDLIDWIEQRIGGAR